MTSSQTANGVFVTNKNILILAFIVWTSILILVSWDQLWITRQSLIMCSRVSLATISKFCKLIYKQVPNCSKPFDQLYTAMTSLFWYQVPILCVSHFFHDWSQFLTSTRQRRRGFIWLMIFRGHSPSFWVKSRSELKVEIVWLRKAVWFMLTGKQSKEQFQRRIGDRHTHGHIYIMIPDTSRLGLHSFLRGSRSHKVDFSLLCPL